jgi:hypothetical protein
MVDDAFGFLDGWDEIAEITFLWELLSALKLKVCLGVLLGNNRMYY